MGWGGCWSEERQTVKKEGGGVLVSPPSHEFLSTGQMLPHILSTDKWRIVSLDKGTVFPLMGISGRRNSLKYRPSESSWTQQPGFFLSGEKVLIWLQASLV